MDFLIYFIVVLPALAALVAVPFVSRPSPLVVRVGLILVVALLAGVLSATVLEGVAWQGGVFVAFWFAITGIVFLIPTGDMGEKTRK